MKRPFVLLISVAALVAAGGAAFWGLRERRPPGRWGEYSIEKIRAGWAKEQAWSQQPFTSIRDSEEFRAKLAEVKTRIEAPVSPEQVEALRRILYDQLVCRSTGSLECYEERFAAARQNPLNDEARRWIGVKYRARFGRDLSSDWSPQAVFDEMWRAEYGGNCGERFEAVALGPEGALIAIGTVRSNEHNAVPPESFFTKKEIQRWVAWPGAARRRPAEFHPGPRSLSSILEQRGECTYAQVVTIVRSANGEVWCWATYWYLDPFDNLWQLHGSIVTTRRPGYHLPM